MERQQRNLLPLSLCAPGTGANSAVQIRYTLGSEEY